ncbi:hypothetical protein [Gorillibacterium sp. CAU 1737]|uniref:hypothetical protein n=1 Tax=Gorillibacterium sp. CAU 1737 TaxID=3140362 RepID=UPI003260A59F
MNIQMELYIDRETGEEYSPAAFEAFVESLGIDRVSDLIEVVTLPHDRSAQKPA